MPSTNNFVWTPELHELYMSAVDKLGGPDVGIATPTSILHEMKNLNQHSGRSLNLESLTARRVQSYLQRDRADRLKQSKPAWLYACIATLAAFAYLYKYPPYPQYCVLFAELTPWVRFMLTSALQQLSTPMICKALRNA